MASMTNARVFKRMSRILLCGFVTVVGLLYMYSDNPVEWKLVEGKVNRQTNTTSKFPQLLIQENYTGVPCNDSLDRPQEEMMAKIDSYSFPGIERYITDLFPESSDQVLPEEPVFVTAFSSNHFKEGLAFFYNFNKWINKNKNRKLFVYDIGLNAQEIKQLVARKHPFVLWMDPSVRFNKSNITKMIMRAKQYGAMGTVDRFGSIAYQTSIDMFRHLNEPPCLYVKCHEIATNFVFIYSTPFITKYIMKPWVSCALIRGCMTPFKDVAALDDCNGKYHYFHCHRGEQSLFGILLNRLFYKSKLKHTFNNGEYYKICRGCLKLE